MEEAGLRLVAEGQGEFFKALDNADKAVRNFVGNVEGAGPRFASFSDIATGALRRVGEVAVNAFAEAGRALASTLGDTVTVAADYEATLNRFAAVTGDALGESGKTIEQFSGLFLQLGADTQFSAAQAAQAAVELAKGGIEPAAIAAGALEAALGLAAAGELELANAAEITAKQLGVWADAGVTAANVADLMASAANASTVSVDELALGLAQVGSVGKLAGLTFEEVVTTIAQISPGFSSASDAGTSFKAFLNSLQPTTKPAVEEMIKLGLATEDGISLFYDAEGAFIGMESAAQLLREATEDLSEADRTLALKTIFGSDAQRAAALIAEGGADAFREMGKEMRKAGGAAEQAAARNKGFAFAVETLKGSFETLQIVVGSALLPTLTDLIQNTITPGVNAFMEFSQGILAAEDPMGALVSAIERVVPGVGELVAAFQRLALGRLVPEFTALAGIMQGAFTAALSALSTTVLPMLANAIDYINEHWDGFSTALLAVGAVLMGPLVVGAITFLVGVLGTLLSPIGLLVAGVAALGYAWGENWGGIQEKTRAVLDYLSQAFAPVLTAIQTFGSGALQEIITFVTGGATEFANLQALLSGVVAFVGQAISNIVGYVQAQLPTWIATLQQWSMEAWAWIQRAIPTAIIQLTEWGASLLGYLTANLPLWTAELLKWGGEAVEWLVDAIPVLIENAGKFQTELLNWASGTLLPALVEAGVEFGRALYEWVETEVVPRIGPELEKFGMALAKAINKIREAAWEAAKEIGQAIIDGIRQQIEAGAQAVWDAVNNLFAGVTGTAESAVEARSPSQVFARIGSNIISGLLSGLTSGPAVTAITTLFNSVLGVATSMLPQLMAILKAWGDEAWMWIQRAIPLLQQQITAWSTTLFTGFNATLPLWNMHMLLWQNEAWMWLQRALPLLMTQQIAFSVQVQTWAQGVVLPAMQSYATEWATALWIWIPNELIPNALVQMQAFLAMMVQQMKIIAKRMYKEGEEVGKNIIDGIRDAIGRGESALVSTIIATIKAAIAAAQSELGIGSPSKVFHTMGEQTMQGLAGGISSSAGLAADAMGSAIASVIGMVPDSLGMGLGLDVIPPARHEFPLLDAIGRATIEDTGRAVSPMGRRVAPPASPGQMAAKSIVNNNSRAFTYAPNITSNQAPPAALDFATALALAGGMT